MKNWAPKLANPSIIKQAWAAMLDQVNLDCFLASDNANKQGNTKTTTAPHKAPEYLIIFPEKWKKELDSRKKKSK